jgi:HlyD family secretion protein
MIKLPAGGMAIAGFVAGLGVAGSIAIAATHPWPHRAAASAGIPVSGNVEVTSVELAFKVPGRLAARPVDEGQRLHTGEVVARLDPGDFDRQVNQAEAALHVAEANAARAEAAYQAVLAGSREQDLSAAASALSEAMAIEAQARRDLGRLAKLYDSGAISRQSFEAAQTARDTASARVTQAHERLDLLKAGARRQDIAQAKAAWQQTRAGVEQARQALALARSQRAEAELRSPVNGTVVAKEAEPGEVLAPGAPVVTVADLSHPWVRGYVTERDLGRVHLNQAAEVKTDSHPNERFRGRVSFISPESEFTPKNVQTPQDRVKLVYRITIALSNPQDAFKPGMPVDAVLLDEPRATP